MGISGLVFGFSSPCSTLVSLRFSGSPKKLIHNYKPQATNPSPSPSRPLSLSFYLSLSLSLSMLLSLFLSFITSFCYTTLLNGISRSCPLAQCTPTAPAPCRLADAHADARRREDHGEDQQDRDPLHPSRIVQIADDSLSKRFERDSKVERSTEHEPKATRSPPHSSEMTPAI
jgi:hypothetical protein